MKKKYIAAIAAVVVLAVMASGVLMLFGNHRTFHRGHALISQTGTFIFVDESGSPITLGSADEKKFSGIADGDSVLVLYGMVMTSYPGQSDTPLCIKLSDGTVDDVNEDTLNQLKGLGWIK